MVVISLGFRCRDGLFKLCSEIKSCFHVDLLNLKIEARFDDGFLHFHIHMSCFWFV